MKKENIFDWFDVIIIDIQTYLDVYRNHMSEHQMELLETNMNDDMIGFLFAERNDILRQKLVTCIDIIYAKMNDYIETIISEYESKDMDTAYRIPHDAYVDLFIGSIIDEKIRIREGMSISAGLKYLEEIDMLDWMKKTKEMCAMYTHRSDNDNEFNNKISLILMIKQLQELTMVSLLRIKNGCNQYVHAYDVLNELLIMIDICTRLVYICDGIYDVEK